ncbi:outer membrane protein assembly factor BamC [Inhella proteolytica]|uniref:Outer membrane protein assembly factor BamC n=1 Tax=Inhella proteolytica TaxID=2795029 RepID=A0A931J2R5_9BURK|nr:outer membrane protein assembly factor BamC [Inhella proteolytica]MBH9576479.1 outer membrane protein assembly factor BamC [Inhella proteolytica]
MTRFPLRALSLALAAALGGCSSFDPLFNNDKVDYRTQSKQTPGLEVPPDLSQLQRQAPLGAAGSVSAAALATQPTAVAVNTNQVALNSVPGAEIVRVGAVRLIRTSMSPEEVWPVTRAFWTELGFDLPKDQADVGVLETDWKENRAKLPKDFIRRTIGTVLEGLYSTGERDQFRTRLERVDGKTEITVTHRGMHEVYTNAQRDQVVWTPRPADTELEAEMLSRLLLRLGGKAPVALAEAGKAPAATPPSAPAVDPAKLALSEVPNEIKLGDDFEKAWRRVGQSLDRHGFTVEDRDRRAGLFFLRYADPSQAGKDEPNFLQRLFSSDKGPTTGRYRVAVKSDAKGSVVSVQDSQGVQQTNDNAKRILALLLQDLR